MQSNYPKITYVDVGILMAIYPIGYLITAPLIGGYMSTLGKKNSVLLGVLIMMFGTLMFALGGMCKHAMAFFMVSFAARLLQGIGDAIISVTIPSIIVSEFNERQEFYLGWLNMADGAGCILGPLIGSLVYRYFNYVNTMFFFTAYITILGLTAVFYIPARLNICNENSNEDSISIVEENISYRDMLRNGGVCTCLTACMVAMICLCFVDPILAIRLISFGVTESNVGVIFAIMGSFFGIGAAFSGWLCEKLPRVVVM